VNGGAALRQVSWSAFPAMCVAIAAAVSGDAAGAPPPPGALEAIARVNRSAGHNDFAALRADMIQDFRWSFGGDSSADQAIDEWKKQPRQMRQLAKITRAKCAYRKDGYVECPANVGTSFRAGFKLRDGQWKMEYFVGGD
jgi:hypothetical protein